MFVFFLVRLVFCEVLILSFDTRMLYVRFFVSTFWMCSSISYVLVHAFVLYFFALDCLHFGFVVVGD